MAMLTSLLLLLGLIGITSGNFCGKRFVNGKWVTHGDCGKIPDRKSIVKDLRKAEDGVRVTATTGTAAENIVPTTSTTCSDEGLFYDGKCFTLPGYSTTSYDMNHDEAKSECAKHGALLAEVHDRAQQDALINYIRSRNLRNGSVVEVWVGTQYQTATSTLLYRSGKQVGASHFRWWPSYPNSNKYVAFDVSSTDSQYNGLWNSVMSQKLQGVVCEKVIKVFASKNV